MAYKGQSSFGKTAMLYTYWACKALFWPIRPTNTLVQMAYKGQSSFRKPEMIRISAIPYLPYPPVFDIDVCMHNIGITYEIWLCKK